MDIVEPLHIFRWRSSPSGEQPRPLISTLLSMPAWDRSRITPPRNLTSQDGTGTHVRGPPHLSPPLSVSLTFVLSLSTLCIPYSLPLRQLTLHMPCYFRTVGKRKEVGSRGRQGTYIRHYHIWAYTDARLHKGCYNRKWVIFKAVIR